MEPSDSGGSRVSFPVNLEEAFALAAGGVPAGAAPPDAAPTGAALADEAPSWAPPPPGALDADEAALAPDEAVTPDGALADDTGSPGSSPADAPAPADEAVAVRACTAAFEEVPCPAPA